LKFALGLGAVGGFDAFVEAGQFLADRLAFRFRSFAGGVAMSRLANRFTLGASFLFALILRASNSADGFFAVDSAFGAGGFFALHLAFRAFAHGVANSRAGGVIALPFALRVAFFCGGNSHQQHESNSKEKT